MVLLPKLTAIRFSGADAGDFLHNQVSNDVLGLAPDESTFACYCEPKGRVLALMLVSRHLDDYLLIISASLAESIARRLKIYVMRAKVSIEVLDEFAIMGMDVDKDSQALPAQLAAITIPNSSKCLLIAQDVAAVDSLPGQAAQWKLAELHAGISWLCPETSAQFLPQMLGFDQLGAINYRKGCYPGQEIVARTHYLGKVKRHPRLLCTPAMICPEPMEKIEIRSASQSYPAIIADCTQREDGGSCLFVVTRMDPDLSAEKIEYRGQQAAIE